MKSYLRVAALATVATLSTTPTACSHSDGPSGPLSRTELITRLLTAESVPAGLRVLNLGGAGPVASAPPSPTAPPTCADLVAAPIVLFADPAAVPIDRVIVAIDGRTRSGEPWLGNEALWNYRSGGAHQALEDLRGLVGGCPSYRDPSDSQSLVSQFTIVEGPDLGDESLRLRQVSQLYEGSESRQIEQEIVFIRSGDVLIMVDEQPLPALTVTPLDVVASAAYRKFAKG